MTPADGQRDAKVVQEFRANAGIVGGVFEGVPIALLHSTGARSGTERITPLIPLLDGERLFVFASNGGAPRVPDWYHNLVERPLAAVELGAERFAVTARLVEGLERDRIVARQLERYPSFAEYLAKAGRTIPVVELVRTT
jgi:deazaflavin-dependent oxidoreductase (nitroreductase family)